MSDEHPLAAALLDVPTRVTGKVIAAQTNSGDSQAISADICAQDAELRNGICAALAKLMQANRGIPEGRWRTPTVADLAKFWQKKIPRLTVWSGEFIASEAEEFFARKAEYSGPYADVAVECNKRLAVLLNNPATRWEGFPIGDGPKTLVGLGVTQVGRNEDTGTLTAATVLFSVEQVHRLWSEKWKLGTELKHPLAPLVGAWLAQPPESKPYRPRERASLVAAHRIKADDVKDMPGFPDGTTHGLDNQTVLPGFDALPSGCPAWLLWAYRQTGKSQGGVAPWDLRLWIGALLNLAIGDRDGEWHTVRVDTVDVENWLHPNGWANRRKHFHKLTDALHMMDKRLSWLPVPGVGSVAMLRPTVIPTSRSDPIVEFVVRVPRTAAHGARLNWWKLSQYGCESALKYRAYLSAMCMLDHSARRGVAITAEIERPLLDSHGRPIYRKAGGGRSVVARAKGELIPNSLAKLAPKLTDKAMAQVIGHDSNDRMSRRRARRAFEDLAVDGVIDLRTNSNGTIGLFGPAREGRLIEG